MEPRFIVKTDISEDLIRLMSRQACTFSSMQYDRILSVQEYPDSFILHRAAPGTGLILPKGAFTFGTRGEFRSFLEREKGKPLKAMR